MHAQVLYREKQVLNFSRSVIDFCITHWTENLECNWEILACFKSMLDDYLFLVNELPQTQTSSLEDLNSFKNKMPYQTASLYLKPNTMTKPVRVLFHITLWGTPPNGSMRKWSLPPIATSIVLLHFVCMTNKTLNRKRINMCWPFIGPSVTL